MPQIYSRKISPIERLSLTANEIYHYNVVGIVEGIGALDPQVLQLAVDKAAAANPGIRVRLRGWLGWARWVDSGTAPKVRVLPQSDWDGNSEIGASFLEERLDALRGGPVADVLVVPGADGRTRYVFRNLHGAIDGRGAMHWTMDVFRILRGELPIGSHSAVTDVQVQERYADKIVPDASPDVSAISVVAPGELGGEPLHFIWRRIIIDRNVGQILPKTAVFLAEYARRREPGDVAFTIPVDYRGLRTQELSVGNLTGYLRLIVRDGATPRSLMSDLRAQIETFADCRPVAGAQVMRWLPFSSLRRRIAPKFDFLLYELNKVFPTGGLVSMGMLAPELYSCPGFQAEVIVGIPGAVGKLNVVFMNRSDSVVVCFTAPARYNDRGQFDEMVKAYQVHFSRAGQIS
jgi:hypothetical protein